MQFVLPIFIEFMCVRACASVVLRSMSLMCRIKAIKIDSRQHRVAGATL